MTVLCRNRLAWGQQRCQHVCQATAPSSTTVQPANPSSTSREGKDHSRKLIFLRHAESETRANTRDHDRPLSAKGKAQATEIAKKLEARGWLPDLVLASNAKRTRETLDEMSSVIHALTLVDAHYYGSLYTVAALDGQTASHLTECLREVVDDARHHCVLVVGHNKGWEEAASTFAGCPIKLKTASAALLKVTDTASWNDVLKEDIKWELVDVLTPSQAHK